MGAKEYLKQLQRLDGAINLKQRELEDLRLKSKSVGSSDYSRERIKSNLNAEAPFVKFIERIAELEEEISSEICFFISEKHKIINQIQTLSDASEATVLYKRYA